MASEQVIGKLSVRLVRGHNLIIADPLTQTSDPYVVLSYGSEVDPPVPTAFLPPLPSNFFSFSSQCFGQSTPIFDPGLDGGAVCGLRWLRKV